MRKILAVFIAMALCGSARAMAESTQHGRFIRCLFALVGKKLPLSRSIAPPIPSAASIAYTKILNVVENNYLLHDEDNEVRAVKLADMIPSIRRLDSDRRHNLREEIARHVAENSERNKKADFAMLLALGDTVSWNAYVDILAQRGCNRNSLIQFSEGIQFLDETEKTTLLGRAWVEREKVSTRFDLSVQLSPKQALDLFIRVIQQPGAVYNRAIAKQLTPLKAFRAAYEAMLPPESVRDQLSPLIPFDELTNAAMEWYLALHAKAVAGTKVHKYIGMDIQAPTRFEDLNLTYDQISKSSYPPPFRLVISDTKLTLLIYPVKQSGERVEPYQTVIFPFHKD